MRSSCSSGPGRGYVLICINRGDYWQFAYVIPSGQFNAVKTAGLKALRSDIAELFPQLADRTKELTHGTTSGSSA